MIYIFAELLLKINVLTTERFSWLFVVAVNLEKKLLLPVFWLTLRRSDIETDFLSKLVVWSISIKFSVKPLKDVPVNFNFNIEFSSLGICALKCITVYYIVMM